MKGRDIEFKSRIISWCRYSIKCKIIYKISETFEEKSCVKYKFINDIIKTITPLLYDKHLIKNINLSKSKTKSKKSKKSKNIRVKQVKRKY